MTKLSRIIKYIFINRCALPAAILFLSLSGLYAQQTYFQQEVNYKIHVTLNDVNHTLSGIEEIQYINNSSTSLSYIYFHLWPNAYKNNQTALAKQLLQKNNGALYFSKEDEKGYIDSLNFKVNGTPVKIEYDPQHIDICKLILNQPLRSLDTITITTPFFVKIPSAKFSRLGHRDQAYYITQWYPKPAVFDKEGWHPMPYLDQGEFYSEFGAFDVSITLPKNYVVAATGDMVDDQQEIDFINNNVLQTIKKIDSKQFNENDLSFPPSSPETKTLRFMQYRIHDFAWFADKRFHILHDQIELPNTRKTVDTWVYFTNNQFSLWQHALDYVNESTLFYSYLLGDYPYNHVSAVDGVIMAGGGMEYPNITVIGEVSDSVQLDITIAHEVGHNWFYGILGSNEREFPFLDEGLNSLYEMRYARAKYPNLKLGRHMGLDSSRKLFGINNFPYWKEKEISYFISAKANEDQPIFTKAQDFSDFNYGAIIYGKAPVAFDYLRDCMGEETFDKAMQFYYENYRFKHPKPGDLMQTLQYFSVTDLSWFEKYMLNGRYKIDYKINRVKRNKDGSYTLKIKNKTHVPVPFNVYGYKNNKPIGLIWSSGADSLKKIYFPPADVDFFKIDGLDIMPDINRKNNYIRTKGLFKKIKAPELRFITHMPNPNKNSLYYLPIMGYNVYNGYMAGMAFHNYSLYEKKFDLLLAPMFGFKSKNLTGFADVAYNFRPLNFFRQISVGVKAKKFNEDFVSVQGQEAQQNMAYFKVAPYINIDFAKKGYTKEIAHSLSFQTHIIQRQQLFYESSATSVISYTQNTRYVIHDLNYFVHNSRLINPWFINFNIQSDAKMLKTSMQWKQHLTITPSKKLEMRLFAGVFLMGNELEKGPYRFRMSGFTGAQDYLYEANYLGRNAAFNALGGNQFTEADGAFKVWTPLGQSSDYLIALNIKSPNVWKLPIRAYADIGTAGKNSLLNNRLLMDAGISLSVVKNIWEVYIPLVYSNDIKKTLELNNYKFIHTIRFTFNLHYIKPKEILSNNLF